MKMLGPASSLGKTSSLGFSVAAKRLAALPLSFPSTPEHGARPPNDPASREAWEGQKLFGIR